MSERLVPTIQQRLLEEATPHWSRLVALAIRRGCCPDTAQDFAQETMLRVAEAGKPFDGDPWPYMATIAINLIRDGQRRTARENDLVRKAELRPTDVRSFEHVVHGRDEVHRLLVLLQAAEDSRTVSMIVVRARDGLTWPEVGEKFGVTAAAAQSCAHRAIVRLRSRLKTDQKDLA